MSSRFACLVLFVCLLWSVGGVRAQGQGGGCPRSPEPYISVLVADPGPRVSTTKSLEQINAMAGSHDLLRRGELALGMTEIDLDNAINVRFRGASVSGGSGGMCVSVTRVDVRFGLGKHFVHIPREYPRGSCQFQVVLAHEMAHVDVNRRTVHKYADVLKNELRTVIRRTGAQRARTLAEGQRAQVALLQGVIDDVGKRFNAELMRLHNRIDAPSSKHAAINRCAGW